MRTLAALGLALGLLGAGCGGGPATDPDAGPPPVDAPRVDAPRAPIDAGDAVVVAGGDVSGDWCGYLHVTGAVRVPAGATLTVCAGAIVEIDAGIGITVEGTLVFAGTDADRITVRGAGGTWAGLTVAGTLEGDFADLSGASVCVGGGAASAIRLDDSSLTDCGQSFAIQNGATFDRTVMTRGSTNNIRGGVLRMTDSTIDFEHPTISPDCLDVRGGGMVLDHVRVTGCHCPIHIVSSDAEMTVTGSIFDGAANPVMIADSVATFHGNHFIGTSTFLDIGGGIEADVAGNYWGGGEPTIASVRPTQFTGTEDFLTTPIPGVGPR